MKYEITLRSGNLKIRATAKDEFELSTAIYHMRVALDEDVGERQEPWPPASHRKVKTVVDPEVEAVKELARKMSYEITPEDINVDALPAEDLETFKAERNKEFIQPAEGQTLSGIILPKQGVDF